MNGFILQCTHFFQYSFGHFRAFHTHTFLTLVVTIILTFPQLTNCQQKSSCVSCHLEEVNEDHEKLVKDFLNGAHAKRGIGCEGCHGGDPQAEDAADAMDPDIGYIGIPARHDIPAMCARCHADPNYMRAYNPNISTDQYSKYLISGHGKRLTKSHDPKVAVCTSCHGTHDILPPNDPSSSTYSLNIPATCAKCHSDSAYMAGRNIPTNQFAEFSHSVHGEALLKKGDRSAPSCTGCHGSHEARRPDPQGVANTCAQCHSYNRELFIASPHKAAHEKHNYPECEVCHGNHDIKKTSDDMLISETAGVCQKCHDPGTKGMLAAITMKAAIDTLKMSITNAKAVVEIVRNYGMSTEDPEYQLRQANDKLVQSRAVIHAFAPDKVALVALEGRNIALQAENQGKEILEQYNFRRRGFILSVIVILILSFLLTVKIRALDSEQYAQKQ